MLNFQLVISILVVFIYVGHGAVLNRDKRQYDYYDAMSYNNEIQALRRNWAQTQLNNLAQTVDEVGRNIVASAGGDVEWGYSSDGSNWNYL
uniref:Uncharacterized protein n=1 Tax=Acrobeloides nanus TaxID=290746 RepID=A0A914D5D5_9BILA